MPLILSLLCFLLLAQPAKAMFPDEQPERHAPRLARLDPRWELESLRGKLPDEIIIFDKQTPINDELFAKLNPEWQKLSQTLTPDQKNGLLEEILWYPGGDYNYHIARCLYAQTLAICADASIELPHGTMLYPAALKDDYELAKYVLAKLPQGQKKLEEEAVRVAKSVQVAELLLAADVPMPENIIEACITHNRPVELMKFYLQQGANSNAWSDDFSPGLHECTFNKRSLVFVPILLDAGADITLKNFHGHTIFHEAFNQDNPKFCECVVDYFLMKEKAVTIYLGCLKKHAPKFYNETKHLRRALVRSSSPLLRLKKVLEMSDEDGRVAYQIQRLEILNPVNCTYGKLRELRRKSGECTPLTNDHIE